MTKHRNPSELTRLPREGETVMLRHEFYTVTRVADTPSGVELVLRREDVRPAALRPVNPERDIPKALPRLRRLHTVNEIAASLGVSASGLALALRAHAKAKFAEGIAAGRSASEMRDELSAMGLGRRHRAPHVDVARAVRLLRHARTADVANTLGVTPQQLTRALMASGTSVAAIRQESPLARPQVEVTTGQWRQAVSAD